MKYKIEKLGENLYEVVMSWWYIDSRRLVSACLEIQGYGRDITHIHKDVYHMRDVWLVFTACK